MNSTNVRRFVLRLFACTVITLLGAQVRAQSPANKEVWEWTDEERIAARLDPAGVQERVAARRLQTNSSHVQRTTDAESSTSFVVDGSRNPELFMPFELFTSLLGGVNPTVPASFRESTRKRLAARIAEFGYVPGSFWSDLESAVQPYLVALDENSRIQAGKAKSSKEAVDAAPEQHAAAISLCRARLRALRAARAQFGAIQFDKFLYRVVAPGLTISSALPEGKEADGLRYLAGGCQ